MTISLNDPQLLKAQAYINGCWVDGSTSQTFTVTNPASGNHVAEIASATNDDTRSAIESAERAMKSWRLLSAHKRSEHLERMHQLVIEHKEDLALLMTIEQGKVLAESRAEIEMGASFFKWFAEEAKRVYGDVLPQPQMDRRGVVIKQAVGVVAAITPWNFPHGMICRKVAPALAVGCAVVLKPSEETPLSALALAELVDRSGLPAGLFNVLPTIDTQQVGAELTSNPIVKKLTFTGSTAVGKLLMSQCAATVKRTSMELGGNAPVIVFDDADLDLAVEGAAVSKYRNSGQTCICANRIFVQDTIYDAFVEKFSVLVNGFSVGDGLNPEVTHGPLINAAAVSKMEHLVKTAITEGAKVLQGGEKSMQGDCFYQPTILSDVTSGMSIFYQEIFGPIAAICRFTSEEELAEYANDTEYGLAAYLYTENMGRIWRVSEKLDYGMVGVNETAISHTCMPFGGIKESGQGREGSKYGLDDYLETKYICMGALDRK